MNDSAHAAKSGAALGTSIRYDPALIGRLVEDHRALVALYQEILGAAEAGRLQETTALLAEFRKQLTAHLLTEAVKLYVYLRHRLGREPARLKQMRAFSSEMVKIGRVVIAVIEEHARLHDAPEKRAPFIERWKEIGAVLSDRIDREERLLYPMYETNDWQLADALTPRPGQPPKGN